jgi:DNA-binding response OmpR family regulator
MTESTHEKMTVLVVDDDPVSAERTASVLKTAGYGAMVASDGRKGLEMARQYRPALILMDALVPGMSGVDACRELTNDPASNGIPVIFLTAGTTETVLEEAFRVGGSDFVCKPVRPFELLTRVSRTLKLQQATLKRTDEGHLKSALENAGGVCHNLNQPLQYVLGAVQILMMDVSPEDPTYAQLDTIREKIELMGDMTRKLAEVTRCHT